MTSLADTKRLIRIKKDRKMGDPILQLAKTTPGTRTALDPITIDPAGLKIKLYTLAGVPQNHAPYSAHTRLG